MAEIKAKTKQKIKMTRKEKLRLTARIIALVLSAAACISSAICLIYYYNLSDKSLSSIVLLPFLIANLSIVAIVSVTTFQNLKLNINKITFIFNFISIILIAACFIYLYG